MCETKEMMIKLPMIEMAASENVGLAKLYPHSGRYIIRRDNGDTSIADVQMRPIGDGEARSDDEQATVYETFVGQPELLDPKDWALAIDIENAKNAYEADIMQMKEDLQDERDRHEAEMAEQKEKCETACRETEENCKKLIEEKEAELQRRMDAIDDERAKNYQLRKMELEQEYEKKKLQLELDTPKRFAQGEWVSGKTLTEIIRTLTAGKKED